MKLTDVKKIRMIVKGSGCKVHFLKREGAPFLLKKLFQNSGLLGWCHSFYIRYSHAVQYGLGY